MPCSNTGPRFQAADRDFQACNAFLAGDCRLPLRTAPMKPATPPAAARHGRPRMPHRIAAIRLKSETFGHLPGKQIPHDILVAGGNRTLRALNGVSQLVLM